MHNIAQKEQLQSFFASAYKQEDVYLQIWHYYVNHLGRPLQFFKSLYTSIYTVDVRLLVDLISLGLIYVKLQ